MNLSNHREYVECKLASLRKYICTLDAVMAWVMETRMRLSISQELPQHERNEMIKNIIVSYNIFYIVDPKRYKITYLYFSV